MRVVLAVTGENVGTPRAQTFDRLSHQRRSPMYALSNLRRQHFESVASKNAGVTLLLDRQRRRDGEVVASVQSDGLAHDFEIAIEVLELASDQV